MPAGVWVGAPMSGAWWWNRYLHRDRGAIVPHMSISGTNILDTSGQPFIPRGTVLGHGELDRTGDAAEARAMGANVRRIPLARWWTDDTTGFQTDAENDAAPGYMDPTYWARVVGSATRAKAQGMMVHGFYDTNCGQGVGTGAVCKLDGVNVVDFASNTTESNAKKAKYIAMILWTVGQLGTLLDSIEILVEPAGNWTQTSYWDFLEQVMTAVLAIAPHMLFVIGAYPNYQATSIGNSIRPGWTDIGSPYRNHVIATCNGLTNLASNPVNRVDRVNNYIVPARTALGVPVLLQQMGTRTDDDPTDEHLDAFMTLLDQNDLGYMAWEERSIYPTSYGWTSLSDPNDANSALVLKPQRKAIYQAHFTGTPVFLTAPVIVGTPTLGQPVDYISGAATGRPQPTIATLVMVDGVSRGAPPYTIVAGDIGKQVAIKQTATNVNGSVVSNSAAVVAVGTDNTWLGQKLLAANVGPGYDFNTRVFVNLNVNGRGWAPNADPYGDTNVTLKADGYPDVGTTSNRVFISDIDDSEADVYHCECLGDFTVAPALISNMGGGTLGARTYDSVSNKTSWTVTIAGSVDNILALKFASAPADFGGLKVHPSAYPLTTTKVFRDEAIAHFALFSGLRFMDWLETNGNSSGPNTDTNWATSRASKYNTAGGYQHSVKACLDLAAAASLRLAWLCTPARATNDFFAGYAAEVKLRRSGSTTALSEFGNELWNNNLGNSTAYQDIRTASFALADVRANTDGLQTIDRAATTKVVTVVLDNAHTKVAGDQIIFSSGFVGGGYQGFDAPGFRTLSAGTDGPTGVLKFVETGGDALAHSATISGDNTYVILSPAHTLARTLTSHHSSGVVGPNDVRIRYMLQRAKALYDAIAAVGDTTNHKVVLSIWTDALDNYAGPLMWALEEYGNLSWLYSMPSSMYVEVTNTGAINSVDEVFNQLDAYVAQIMPKEVRWANFQRTFGLHPMNYESGFHTHVGAPGDPYTTYILQAHLDDRARLRLKTWWQDLNNRGVEESFFFHAGITKTPTSGNATWPVTYSKFANDATSKKYAAFNELSVASALSHQVDTINFGNIRYVDVFPNGNSFLSQSSNWFVVPAAEAVNDITNAIAVDNDGNYSIAWDASTNGGGTVAYTAYVDDVQISTGNLPSGSIFTGAPGQAFSVSMHLTPGRHIFRAHVPNASRADWVGLYRVRVVAL